MEEKTLHSIPHPKAIYRSNTEAPVSTRILSFWGGWEDLVELFLFLTDLSCKHHAISIFLSPNHSAFQQNQEYSWHKNTRYKVHECKNIENIYYSTCQLLLDAQSLSTNTMKESKKNILLDWPYYLNIRMTRWARKEIKQLEIWVLLE